MSTAACRYLIPLAIVTCLISASSRHALAQPRVELPPPVPPAMPDQVLFGEVQPPRPDHVAFRQKWQRYYTPPVSQVDNPRARIYSRNVNQILCAVTVPATGNRMPEQTWLGTALGIKRVQKGRGIVRYYDQNDGLPGDVVEAIAADRDGAVAQVWGEGNRRQLCWWDKKTDRWHVLAPMSGTYTPVIFDAGTYSRRTLERFVLTATHVVLAPSYVNPAGYPPQQFNCFRVWSRSALRAGATAPRYLPWNENELDEKERYRQRRITDVAAIGQTVVVNEGQNLYFLSPTTLSHAVTTLPVASPEHSRSTTLPNLPTLPRITLGSDDMTLSALVSNTHSLWILRGNRKTQRTELVQLVPRFWRNTLLDWQQVVCAVPALPLPPASENRSFSPGPLTGGVTLVPQTDGLWLLTATDFLHYTQGRWERRNDKGMLIARDVPTPLPSPTTSPFVKRWIAPPAQSIPDAVARAWITQRNVFPGMEYFSSEAEATPSLAPGGVAWIRQRFPSYFGSPTAAPAFTPLAAIGEWDLYGSFAPERWGVSPQHDPQSSSLWYASRPDLDRTGILWELPAPPPPFFWSPDTYSPMKVTFAQSTLKAGRAVPLPDFPTRVSLRVYGFAVRPEGLYIGTNRGILRLPPSTSSSNPATDTRLEVVPQPPDPRLKYSGFFGSELVQAGPEGTLFVSQNYDRPTLCYDPLLKRFVADSTLGTDRVLGGNKTVLYTTPVSASRRTDADSPPPAGILRIIPLDNNPARIPLLSLPISKNGGLRNRTSVLLSESLRDSTNPFLKELATQIAITHDIIWFHGPILAPAVSRYPVPTVSDASYYGIAGYDLRQKRWTQVLETPREFPFQKPYLWERDGNIYTAFYAPDASVWQYDTVRDTWHAIAPGLPAEAVGKSSFAQTPFLWKVENGHTWLFSNGTIYHHETKAASWTALPAGEGVNPKRPIALSAAQVIEFDNSLFVGGLQTLWRFDLTRHFWEEILPLATTLGNLPVLRNVDSLASDRDRVYIAGGIRVGNDVTATSRFLLAYDKKGTWQRLTAPDVGVPKEWAAGNFWSDGTTVWYTDEYNTTRRDLATGKWGAAGAPRCLQVGPVPGMPGAAYLLYSSHLDRYDERTGQVKTVLNLAPPKTASNYYDPLSYLPPPRLRGMAVQGSSLIISTTGGLYRYVPNTALQRLPLPILRNETISASPEGDVYIWDADTLTHLRR